MKTHYGPAMDPRNLFRISNTMAKFLLNQHPDQKCTPNKSPLLVYRGSSGIALATAIGQHLYQKDKDFKFAQVYIRKIEESTNSICSVELGLVGDFEWMLGVDADKEDWYRRFREHKDEFFPVFVDDFIVSGQTHTTCSQRLDQVVGVTYPVWYGLTSCRYQPHMAFVRMGYWDKWKNISWNPDRALPMEE